MKAKLSGRTTGLLFLLPAIALFAVFVIYPIVYNLQASTLDWDGVNVGKYVGFGNYLRLFQDPIFFITIKNSGLWILLTIVPQALGGFLLALMLNRGVFGSTVYRAIFFIPAILSPVVVGIVWARIMDPSTGLLSQLAQSTGLGFLSGNFLSDPGSAIFAVIAVNVWMWTGFSMLFYLSGLQLIDSSVLEAAKIDGASGFQTTLRITLPLLRSTHLSLLLLGIIGSLKTFELVYVLTQGGPNHASEMLPTYAFEQAFQQQSVGYASTISVVLLVIAVVSSLAMVRVFGSGFISGDEK
jgi:ABC-type sugar transport systems, permease components